MGQMLRIEKYSEGCATRLQLSGRFGSELIAFVRSVMSNGCARKILDLSEITLVDVEVVRFLIHCDDEGIELFLLNGFGVINQAIPAKEMMERGVPPDIVPFAMLAGRFLEIVAGFGLALGVFPRWSAFLLFAFLFPATFVSHSFWLATGRPQFQGQLINFCKNIAIWGGLIFIAASPMQPSLLRHRTMNSKVGAKRAEQSDMTHVETR